MWNEVAPPEGFDRPAFQRGNYIAASTFDGTARTWEIFRSGDDGSLTKLSGVRSQSFSSAELTEDNIRGEERGRRPDDCGR